MMSLMKTLVYIYMDQLTFLRTLKNHSHDDMCHASNVAMLLF